MVYGWSIFNMRYRILRNNQRSNWVPFSYTVKPTYRRRRMTSAPDKRGELNYALSQLGFAGQGPPIRLAVRVFDGRNLAETPVLCVPVGALIKFLMLSTCVR